MRRTLNKCAIWEVDQKNFIALLLSAMNKNRLITNCDGHHRCRDTEGQGEAVVLVQTVEVQKVLKPGGTCPISPGPICNGTIGPDPDPVGPCPTGQGHVYPGSIGPGPVSLGSMVAGPVPIGPYSIYSGFSGPGPVLVLFLLILVQLIPVYSAMIQLVLIILVLVYWTCTSTTVK